MSIPRPITKQTEYSSPARRAKSHQVRITRRPSIALSSPVLQSSAGSCISSCPDILDHFDGARAMARKGEVVHVAQDYGTSASVAEYLPMVAQACELVPSRLIRFAWCWGEKHLFQRPKGELCASAHETRNAHLALRHLERRETPVGPHYNQRRGGSGRVSAGVARYRCAQRVLSTRCRSDRSLAAPSESMRSITTITRRGPTLCCCPLAAHRLGTRSSFETRWPVVHATRSPTRGSRQPHELGLSGPHKGPLACHGRSMPDRRRPSVAEGAGKPGALPDGSTPPTAPGMACRRIASW